MRRTLSLLIVGALVLAAPSIASAGKKKKPAGPVKLWEDATGDADVGGGSGSSAPVGVDLVEGSVVKKGANLEFTVVHADMPPIGSLPEVARFLWAFSIDGKNYRLTVKSVDIGKPDVAAGQTTERVGRADVQGHFRLEDECVRDSTLPVGMINCPPLEYLTGTWDAAAKSFTVVVPLASVGAKPGSILGPGGGETSSLCQVCWITHYAERSLNTTVIDSAGMATTYKIPR